MHFDTFIQGKNMEKVCVLKTVNMKRRDRDKLDIMQVNEWLVLIEVPYHEANYWRIRSYNVVLRGGDNIASVSQTCFCGLADY